MTRIARYGRLVAHPERGTELAELLLAAAAALEDDPGCELYLINRQADAPDTVWVTELWRDGDALRAAQDAIKGSPETAAAMKLVAAAEMIELDLLGGKGLPPHPAA
ncbi:antibiotic biosynthesis monooxygenase [Spirillospora sp. NPDC029432]|uniref:putative quinol monooxygenase n=1 Tax=Spirillospora sp. NPDC029432 TaxID=3154599 RepID=UPI0034524074